MAPSIFLTRKMAQEAIDTLIAEGFHVEVWPDEMPPPRQVLLEKAHEADALITLVTDRIDEELLLNSPNLKVVANMAVGFDNFDVTVATNQGIVLSNTPKILTKTTADLTFALLLAAARRVVEGDRHVRQGKWKTWHPQFYLGQDVHEKILGIIGLGQIGLEVGKRAMGFDMQVLYYDPIRNSQAEQQHGFTFCSDLTAVLRQADFVTVHTVLSSATYHLIGKAELEIMKANAILVNASRGAIIDPKALFEALRDGVIAGAGLDVTEPEPIDMSDPLLTLENVIIAPHIGSASHQTRARMASLAVENVIAFFKGEIMPTCINPEALHVGKD